jgi:hypothetical protein
VSYLADLLKVLGPPFLAAFLSGYLVSRWKTREDAIEKRLDELIVQIDAVANAANAYWLKGPQDSEVKLQATKVMAGIARLDGLRSTIAPFLSSAANTEIVAIAGDFLRTSTGGDFGVHNRDADLSRSLQVLLVAASYSVAVRSARMKDLLGWKRRG